MKNWTAWCISAFCILLAVLQIFLAASSGKGIDPSTSVQYTESALSLFLAFAQAFPKIFAQKILPTFHIQWSWKHVSAFLAVVALVSNVLISGFPSYTPHKAIGVVLPGSPTPPQSPTGTLIPSQEEISPTPSPEHTYISIGYAMHCVSGCADIQKFVLQKVDIYPTKNQSYFFMYAEFNSTNDHSCHLSKLMLKDSDGKTSYGDTSALCTVVAPDEATPVFPLALEQGHQYTLNVEIRFSNFLASFEATCIIGSVRGTCY
jgi:hypothetical protein